MDDARPVPLRLRVDRVRVAIAAAAVALVALSVAVVAGALDAVDRYAVAHWMPGLDPDRARHTVPPVSGAFMPFQSGEPSWQKVLDVATYPASVLVSVLVFGAACGQLWRRGRRSEAIVWAVAYVATNAVEVALKAALAKPALYPERDGVVSHAAAVSHSFPSGHTTRALLVAGVVAYMWRRLAWPAAVWAALVPVLLVASSAHVPSDVAGGLLLGSGAVLAAHAAANVRRE
jgi:membrane-associated phospholipid phosphatase